MAFVEWLLVMFGTIFGTPIFVILGGLFFIIFVMVLFRSPPQLVGVTLILGIWASLFYAFPFETFVFTMIVVGIAISGLVLRWLFNR